MFGVPHSRHSISFQPHIMKERIRTFLRWFDRRLIGDGHTFPLYRSTDGAVNIVKDERGELVFASFLETAPAVAVIEKERFQVMVLRGTSSDDSGCYYLDIRFLNDNWLPLLMMHESKLPVIQSALQEVADFIRKNPADKRS